MSMILGKIAGLIVAAATSFGLFTAQPAMQFGAALPSQNALIDTYLASGISTTDTSMTLASGSLRDGTSLTGYQCFTLDAGQPTTEYVCGTASSTAVSAMIRGVLVSNPNATSSALAYAHRRFASVQITDFPFNQLVQRKLNGTDQFDTKLQYSFSATSTFTDAKDIASKGYVDAQATAGCANADTSTKGCVELATGAETAAGTAAGGSGANLVPANSTFNATTSAAIIAPVTKSNGKLSQGFLDLTEAFTFSGAVIHSATTTLSGGNTISGTTTISGATTFSVTNPTLATSTPTAALEAASKGYVDGRTLTSATSSSLTSVTLGASTSTLMMTLAHAVSSTFVVMCGAVDSTANNVTTYSLRTAPATGEIGTCTVGTGTGNPAGCSMSAIQSTAAAATSTSFYINKDTTGTTGRANCSAFTIR